MKAILALVGSKAIVIDCIALIFHIVRGDVKSIPDLKLCHESFYLNRMLVLHIINLLKLKYPFPVLGPDV